MPYGDDITEGIPYVLSNPANSTTYAATREAYDVAIAGLPFFLMNSDDSPYRRVTAQYRKQQIDQTREAGEQTLTGWWLRSQSSFHLGAGIKFFEPQQEESLRFQFTESKGLDVWTRGQATLLNDTTLFYSGGDPAQLMGVNDGTNDCIVITDGTAIKKITSASVSTTYTQAGTASNIFSITTNGKQYFFINGTHVHRGNLAGTTSDTEIYNASSTTRGTIRYVKQRLIAAVNNSIYELDPNNASGALPTALFTHPNTSWVWSSIAEGPQAIYISGYDPNGTSSSVFKIGLDTANTNALGFPELLAPTVIIDLPQGESINAFDVYLGTYAILATSKGFRVGVSDATGDIQYGPLLFDDAACKGIAFKDSFAFISTLIDGEAALIRTDLSTTVLSNSLFFPWAYDLVATGTGSTGTQVAFFGNSDRVVFSTGSDDVWAESTTSLVASGYLRTGYIRYNTLETKIFKLMQARVDTTNGGVTIQSIDASDTFYTIGVFGQESAVPQININYPQTAQEYLGFQFTLSRSTTDVSKGPLFTGYQIRSLPATPRQRLIQYPLSCFDHETDHFGVEVGFEGAAYDRMSQLELIENNGDTIQIQDFRTGESYLGIIEEMDFRNNTPSDKRFTGFGGLLLVTIRTV